MAEAKERFPDWDRNTRAPNPLPPPLSCDCQIHFYEDTAKYPPKLDIKHELPSGTFADAQRVLKVLGIDRAVLVHASVYDTDYRLLIDILTSLPDRSPYRGVVVLKDEVKDSELQRLQELGVCGIRFHIAARYASDNKKELLRTLARAKELGWHARLHIDPPELLEYADVLSTVRDMPLVIDHMGRLDFALGLQQPAFLWIMDRLKNDPNWWMMVSNGTRMSRLEEGYEDAIPFGKAYIEAAPDRMIWSTDWPHVRWRKQRMMNDAEAVELLYRYVDNDPGLIRKILVENPARLHGYPLT
jgi:predicted TIM-barrel fold metal-dependent hydrolase